MNIRNILVVVSLSMAATSAYAAPSTDKEELTVTISTDGDRPFIEVDFDDDGDTDLAI